MIGSFSNDLNDCSDISSYSKKDDLSRLTGIPFPEIEVILTKPKVTTD